MSNKKYKKQSKFSLDNMIKNSKLDVCKNLKWFLIAPVVIILVGVILLCTVGFNLGIDFTGGSNMTICVDSEVTETTWDLDRNKDKIVDTIEDVLKDHGLKLTTLQETVVDLSDVGMESNAKAVIIKYQNDNSLETEAIEAENDKIRLELLKAFGYVDVSVEFEDLEDIDNAEFVTYGGITTSTASSELMMKSFIALLVAMVLILIYVAFRFEVTSGLAAILALFHDLLITSAFVLMFRIQINVSFIAALITILGYSINNTIIIFDRMRDDLRVAKKAEARINNSEIANRSVKDTMTRSIITALTTFVMISMVAVIGVADIREFAWPIVFGVLSGFYSSVFITPGLWAIAYRPRKRKKTVVKVEAPAEDAE
jgi:preprotein translocase subunit SecF